MLFNAFTCKGNQVQDNFSDEQILSMLKSFYTSYITENSKDFPMNFHNINSIKRKYCTSSLLHKIKKQGLDYDPFLNAQDCDIEWLKTLSIRKDSIRNNLYYVSFISLYNKSTITIKLFVVKQKEQYKIDSIIMPEV